MTDKQKLLISFSGGRTSAFMTQWLLKNMAHKYEMAVVFANTGKEREETLEFVKQCDEHFGFGVTWVEADITRMEGVGPRARVVDFQTASRKGEPFEALLKKFGVVNQETPKCQEYLKVLVNRAWARDALKWNGYYNAVGIRADETHRINWNKANKERVIYPLVTLVRMTKSDINLFWKSQPFDLNLKSYEGNCDLCWKKSMRKLMTLTKERPELADWWREMERNYGLVRSHGHERLHGPATIPKYFFRGQRSIDDIIEESRLPFIPATDESKDIDRWRQLSAFDLEMDSEGDCTESCEAF